MDRDLLWGAAFAVLIAIVVPAFFIATFTKDTDSRHTAALKFMKLWTGAFVLLLLAWAVLG